MRGWDVRECVDEESRIENERVSGFLRGWTTLGIVENDHRIRKARQPVMYE